MSFFNLASSLNISIRRAAIDVDFAKICSLSSFFTCKNLLRLDLVDDRLMEVADRDQAGDGDDDGGADDFCDGSGHCRGSLSRERRACSMILTLEAVSCEG